jgi:hypothetical protein
MVLALLQIRGQRVEQERTYRAQDHSVKTHRRIVREKKTNCIKKKIVNCFYVPSFSAKVSVQLAGIWIKNQFYFCKWPTVLVRYAGKFFLLPQKPQQNGFYILDQVLKRTTS